MNFNFATKKIFIQRKNLIKCFLSKKNKYFKSNFINQKLTNIKQRKISNN